MKKAKRCRGGRGRPINAQFPGQSLVVNTRAFFRRFRKRRISANAMQPERRSVVRTPLLLSQSFCLFHC